MDSSNDKTHVAGLYLSNHLSDITLYVGPSKKDSWKFPAHQLVLCAASPVFTTMFNGNYDESLKREVLIKDIVPYTFHKLLMFLYRGVLNVSTLSEAVDILIASDKYEINKLKKACFKEIVKHELTLDDFWTLSTNYIDFGDQLTSPKIKINIFRFLDNNASRIINHGKFAFMDQHSLLQIVSRNTFYVRETDLCEAIVHWAKIHCCAEHLELTIENQRNTLGPILYEIRFLTIPTETLRNLTIFELLRDDEKDVLTQKPSMLKLPWKYQLMQIRREASWNLNSKTNPFMWSSDYTTTYFVFARDAYLNKLVIWLEDREDRVTNVTISALGKNGTSKAVKNNFKQEDKDPIVTISNIYIKAYCCYKLVLEPRNVRAIVYDDEFDLWGYDHFGRSVFYSVSEEDVVDVQKFHSPEYWRLVFGRQPAAHDEDVVLRVVSSSCILNASAIFC